MDLTRQLILIPLKQKPLLTHSRPTVRHQTATAKRLMLLMKLNAPIRRGSNGNARCDAIH
jgi:hypothetical protein